MASSDDKLVSNVLLAAWLQEQYPELFASLAQQATPANLSGITDVLSSIGSALGTAASKVASGLSTVVQSVGGFLNSQAGQTTLQTLASAKLASSQAQIVQAQAQRAAVGQNPAAISTAYNPATGTYVPVMTNANGQQVPLTQQTLAAITPSFLDKYGLWIAGGAAGLVLLYVLMGRRRGS